MKNQVALIFGCIYIYIYIYIINDKCNLIIIQLAFIKQ